MSEALTGRGTAAATEVRPAGHLRGPTAHTAPVRGAADPAALAQATKLLASGEVIGVPTDTVYGLAAAASDEAAVRQLFKMKHRPYERSVAILVADLAAASGLARLLAPARRLAARYWPGPLTLVAPRTPGAPEHLGDSTTIGVRVPAEHLVSALAVNGPLAVTSANLHGQPTPATARQVSRLFPALPLVLDGGRRPGRASTVVDVTRPVPRVLRQGPVPGAEIVAVAAGAGW